MNSSFPGAQESGATIPRPLSETTEAKETEADDWAICCSGGGIRSAAYCLGALQALDQGGVLAKAKWILGVSGGSYIAASRALVAHQLPPGATRRAYAPGSPEERNLRDNTRYIAPDGGVILVGVLALVFGAAVTFVMAVAPLYALSHAWGWLLRWQGVLVPSGPHSLTASVTGSSWWLPSVIAAGIMLALFALWWLTLAPAVHRLRSPAPWWAWLKPDDRDRGANRAKLVSWATVLTAGLALAMLAAPWLISWLARSTGPVGTIAHFAGFGARPTWSFATLAAVVAAVTAVARFSQAGLAKWNALGGQAAGPAAAKPGLLTQLAGWLRQKLMPWLASAIVVLVGAVLALLWIGDGARAGFGADQLLAALVALLVLLLTRVAGNINRLSMHDFYTWRLADAYAVTRRAAEAQNPLRARELFAEAAATRLSDLRDSRASEEPDLVICGTANINAAREVPPGRGGFCLTFDPKYVALHRKQGGAIPEPARARTCDYEALIGKRRCTLFDVSAISGAAISPLMGAATRHAYRILFTATNIRLGVWLPHPALVQKARQLLDERAQPKPAAAQRLTDQPWTHRPLLLLLWYLSPHPLWNRNAARNFDREARLWAHVLKLRLQGRRAAAVWYQAMQPTLGLLWSEAAGKLSYRSTWMYVTDGGHYDNLGLVEALRRGARHIVVLDASGDQAHSWFTLGGAMALARADAGVEIQLDPTAMTRGGDKLAPGQVVRPWAHGTFSRPSAVPGLPSRGEIWVCKLGWWAGAPWDVLSYARGHSTYPCDPTLEQMYDAAEFEAYHKLGEATVLAAASQCTPPLRWVPAAKVPSGTPQGSSLAVVHGGPGHRVPAGSPGRPAAMARAANGTRPGLDVLLSSRASAASGAPGRCVLSRSCGPRGRPAAPTPAPAAGRSRRCRTAGTAGG